MKNALVLLIETPEATLSGNTLGTEISLELARELCDFFTDLSISELYPVNNTYDFYLLSYSPEEAIRLQKRIGDSFRFLAGKGDTQVEFLLDAASRLEEYEGVIFLKSNTSCLSEETVAGFFDRMNEFDLLFGPSGPAFYLFGIHREALPFVGSLAGLSEENMDVCEMENSLHGFHLPERPIAETVNLLSRLREGLLAESGLARKIDDIIIRATAADEQGK
ncbi:MAG: hypothetical protein DRJ14_04420 [Acidobacteria bacterium]|nr:MAG: hypothetical protein DRJ14_04420 [Acidobacteriota bacterium]